MSNTAQLTALRTSILAFADKIKEISASAQNAANAQKLEGYSLAQVVELISGATESTIHDVELALQAFSERTDNPHQVTKTQVGLGNLQNYGIATNVQALDEAVVNAYMTPQRTWEALMHFWATKVGTAPETLDTIQEIADALQNNPDVILALQDQIANKATRAEVNTATQAIVDQIAQLELDIAATYATKTELATQRGQLEASIAANATAVNNLIGEVATKATAQSVTDLAAVVATKASNQSVSELATLVDTKANSADVTTALTELETAFNDAIASLNAS